MRSASILLRSFLLGAFITTALRVAGEEPPKTFQSDGKVLAGLRPRALAGDATLAPALKQLRADADKALNAGPYAVTQKQFPAPGGDPHDYVSLAPYFWPNPDTPDHLPYVRHDGKRNPETREYDVDRLNGMSGNTYTLGLAYYLTGDQRYAERCALLVRTWFFDQATRMNPNLQHAQLVKGENDGRGTGILESDRFLNVIDGVGLIRGSEAWTDDDQKNLQAWFTEYVKWMRESKNGKAEAAAANNHGSWYDVQVVSFLLFVGDEAGAKQIFETAKTKRIARQIEPDGQQPLELTRTNSFGYSVFNVSALMQLADLGRPLGVDLWTYKTEDGRSLRVAFDYLIPFGLGEKKWEKEQMNGINAKSLFIPLRRAGAAYHEPKYEQLVAKLNIGDLSASRDSLRFPDRSRETAR